MQVISCQISGLGNQLFQYAAGRYYAARYGAIMRMAVASTPNPHSHGYPRPFLLSHFSIPEPLETMSRIDRIVLAESGKSGLAAMLVKPALKAQVIRETVQQRYTFLPDLPLEDGVRRLYLVGYWQAHRIVDDIAPVLRAAFAFRQPAAGRNAELLRQMQQCEQPVSLHIRRGDYTLAVEGNIALPMDYYARAAASLQQQIADPTFFVFSDDIAYARAHLPRGLRAVFVDHNDDNSSHEDLRLMSSCRHHVIANSTFSWWGAWLNARSDKIVVAPRQWHLRPETYYPDLLPPTWQLMDV